MRLRRRIEREKLRSSTYRVIDLLKLGKKILSEKRNPYLESEIIISSHLGLSKEEFILKMNEKISPKDTNEIILKLEERRKGKPLSYVTGERVFLLRKFMVFEGVFIPRFETEEIVYHLVKREEKFENCLDICAGTGVMGISLMLEGKVKNCTFVDINPIAIENIKANLYRFGVSGKVIRSNMFEKVRGKFDLIISNPPYIPEGMLYELDEDVKKEPYEALNGGKDGFKFIRILLSESEKYLKKGGKLVFEYPEFGLEKIENIKTKLKFKEKIPTLSVDIKGAVFIKL